MPETSSKSVPEIASELFELTKSYARQETIDPLKGIGRYLALGVAGALALGIGVILLILSGLRALQTETGSTFTGNWSWLPYVIVLVVATLLVVLAISRISNKKKQ
jgi:hypothetical protein